LKKIEHKTQMFE